MQRDKTKPPDARVLMACEHLRAGKAVILTDDPSREGEGDLMFAALHATPELVNVALKSARGLLCVALPPSVAARFGIRRLADNAADLDTPFGMPISLKDGSTGISAAARAATLRATASEQPQTFCMPGHVATLVARAGGLSERAGHTEGALALLRVAGIDGPGVLCEVLNDAGDVAAAGELEQIAERLGVPVVSISEVAEFSREIR